MTIPDPVFKKNLGTISWVKIYEREYGVQYSEVAIAILQTAKHHFPVQSQEQVVIPSSGGTAFYIDKTSWDKLVTGLNSKYTSHVKKLEEYEKQFLEDGENYLKIAKKISRARLGLLTDKALLQLFQNHQKMRDRYSVFAWSAFILNNYVADRATAIIEAYLKKAKREGEKESILGALFTPPKRAAILELQFEVAKHKGKLSRDAFDQLYAKFKWLSCLDIHNRPWTKTEFKKQIATFSKASKKKEVNFETQVKGLHISADEMEYLMMAKRFVYIKDARDDYRRESVYYSRPLFAEIARRMKISGDDISYLLTAEIENFLNSEVVVPKKLIQERKRGFVLYLSSETTVTCLSGDKIQNALTLLRLLPQKQMKKIVTGRVACQGRVTGTVKIVHGIKDIGKVKKGDVLVAISTHPDYVSAMRRTSAIITDEGGITSHAAIVSREFDIPCIVGTKQATQIFKDGDIVEVDAYGGTVKLTQ